MYEHFCLDDYGVSYFTSSADTMRFQLQLLLRLSRARRCDFISSAHFVFNLLYDFRLARGYMEKRNEREICFRRDLQLSRVKNDAGRVGVMYEALHEARVMLELHSKEES